jgi:hypothetical protein
MEGTAQSGGNGFIWNHKRRKNHKNENGYTARRAGEDVALLLELK